MGKIVALLVSIIGIGSLLFLALLYFSYSNQEVRLRKQIEAQQTNVGVVFDNTWKIIKQKASVADQYKGAFKEIYPALMAGRYGNGKDGTLMKWIKESNPQFDTKLYEQVSNAIETQRTVFTKEQQLLIDLKREHDTLLATVPSKWFLFSRQPIEIKLITSAVTKEAVRTGEENDVDPFKN